MDRLARDQNEPQPRPFTCFHVFRDANLRIVSQGSARGTYSWSCDCRVSCEVVLPLSWRKFAEPFEAIRSQGGPCR